MSLIPISKAIEQNKATIPPKQNLIQATTIAPVIENNTVISKKKAPGVKKAYYDLIDEVLTAAIQGCTRFKLPERGIHKPMLWVKQNNWGLVYKVVARITQNRLKKLGKSSRYDVAQIRWNARKNNLTPEIGYEDFAMIIDGHLFEDLKLKINPLLKN